MMRGIAVRLLMRLYLLHAYIGGMKTSVRYKRRKPPLQTPLLTNNNIPHHIDQTDLPPSSIPSPAILEELEPAHHGLLKHALGIINPTHPPQLHPITLPIPRNHILPLIRIVQIQKLTRRPGLHGRRLARSQPRARSGVDRGVVRLVGPGDCEEREGEVAAGCAQAESVAAGRCGDGGDGGGDGLGGEGEKEVGRVDDGLVGGV